MVFYIGRAIPIEYYQGATGLTIKARVIDESGGVFGAELTLVENAVLNAAGHPGLYESSFTPDAEGNWKVIIYYAGFKVGQVFYEVCGGTPPAANKSIVDAIGATGSDAVSMNYSHEGLMQFMHGSHKEAVILFVVPEAVAAINVNNAAILVHLQHEGEVITITQADALDYPDFSSLTLCVLGSNSSVAWTTANLADLKTVPNLPIICVDKVAAAYLEIGTDGGDAAAKTVLNAVANIEGTMLGVGFHATVGLAPGANTISAAATYHTLDMSDADITEVFFGYETANANTDVLLGLIDRVQPDGAIGVDETGAEVPATRAFYGCGYEFAKLNTLGTATFSLLLERIIHGATIGQAIIISGGIGNLQQKIFGTMVNLFNAASPLAAYIAGNTGGLGTELPNSKSLYDLLGVEYDGTPDQYDVQVTGYTTAAVATAVGAILERLQLLQEALIANNTIFTSSAATVNTVTCAALVDRADLYENQMLVPLTGDQAGQGRLITAYDGTGVLTVAPDWGTDPDAAGNFKFIIMPTPVGFLYEAGKGLVAIFDIVNAIPTLTRVGGTLTATGGVDDLFTIDAPGANLVVTKLTVDLTNMVAGDTVVVRYRERTKTGGT